MTNPEKSSSQDLFSEALLEAIRGAVRVEIRAALTENGHGRVGAGKPSEASRPYLTVKEAAEMARLAEPTIRLFISKRELKANKVGSRVIIKRTDLEQFLEAHPIEILSD